MKIAWLFFKKYVLSSRSHSIVQKISILSMLGILTSVAALVIIVSVMSGFGEAIEKRILSFEPDFVLESNRFENLEKAYQKLLKHLKSNEKEKNTQTGSVYFFTEEQVVIRTVDGQYSGAIARGLDPNSMKHFLDASKKMEQTKTIKYGFSDDQEDMHPQKIGEDGVVVGSDLAYQLGVYIGDQIILTPPETLLLPEGETPKVLKLTVYDIVRTGVQQIDSSSIMFVKKNHAGLFLDSKTLKNKIEIFLNLKDGVDDVLMDVKKNLSVSVSTWKDRNSDLFYSLKMEKGFIIFFLILSLFIGSFSIVSVLVLLATQKKQDMGVLLTLGMSTQSVIRVFSYIGFYLSSISIGLGFFIGLSICWLLKNTYWIQLPDVYYDRSLPIHFVPDFYLFLMFFSLLISYASSFLPSRYILKFSPLDIIKK